MCLPKIHKSEVPLRNKIYKLLISPHIDVTYWYVIQLITRYNFLCCIIMYNPFTHYGRNDCCTVPDKYFKWWTCIIRAAMAVKEWGLDSNSSKSWCQCHWKLVAGTTVSLNFASVNSVLVDQMNSFLTFRVWGI